MQTVKIFLASSSELAADREQFRIFVSVENDRLHTRGLYLKIIQWEYFLDTISDSRLQNEYNKELVNCDLAVCLFFRKVGRYTAEEFDTAYDSFKSIGKPKILTYFRTGAIEIADISEEINTLLKFKQKLLDLGHFKRDYDNTDNLKLHFSSQLQRLFLDKEEPSSEKKEQYVNNLPAQLTEFIGREREIKEVGASLIHPKHRMTIVAGSGGSGKTRLAIQVANTLSTQFAHGICFVALENIADPALVIPAISKALLLKEVTETSIFDCLQQYLKEKNLLLILDNFEQVADSAPEVISLLKAAPGIKALITTRMDLNIIGAAHYFIPPLNFPPHYPPEPPIADYRDTKNLSQYDAVNLFNEIAKSKLPDFLLKDTVAAAVAELCYRLSGIPLAIELAAARSNRYTAHQMLKMPGLTLLAGGAIDLPERQRTMFSTIKWSYELLTPDEKKLFLRLSVFRNGFDDDAVKEICNLDDLKTDPEDIIFSLYQNNLVKRIRSSDNNRHTVLDMIREFGEKMIDRNEEEKLMRRHAHYFVALAEDAETKLTSPNRERLLCRLEEESDNLYVIFDRCRKGMVDGEIALRIAGSLFWFWNLRAYLFKGEKLVREALDYQSTGNAYAAKALYCLGGLNFLQGDMKSAAGYLRDSENIWRSLEKKAEHDRYLGLTLIILSQANVDLLEKELALSQIRESIGIFERLQDDWGLALARNDLGNVLRSIPDYENALKAYRQSLTIWVRLQDEWGEPLTRSNIGFVESLTGNYAESNTQLLQALQIQEKVNDKWGLAETLKCLGDVAIHLNEYAAAKEFYCRSLKLNLAAGRKQLVVACIEGMAIQRGAVRDTEQAIVLFYAAENLRTKIGVFENLRDRKLETTFAAMKDSISAMIGNAEKDTKSRDLAGSMTLQDAAAFIGAICDANE